MKKNQTKKISANIRKGIIAFVFSASWISVVAFLFYLNMNPADIGSFVGARLGQAVATTINKASVAENPVNKFALDLSKKEKELNRYEDLLLERENEINKNSSLINNKILLTLVTAIGALFFLVFLNFYFDHKRRQREERKKEQE